MILERRFGEHNTGKSKYTSESGLWELVFKQEFETLEQARQIEIKLKRLKNRKVIESIINKGKISLTELHNIMKIEYSIRWDPRAAAFRDCRYIGDCECVELLDGTEPIHDFLNSRRQLARVCDNLMVNGLTGCKFCMRGGFCLDKAVCASSQEYAGVN